MGHSAGTPWRRASAIAASLVISVAFSASVSQPARASVPGASIARPDDVVTREGEPVVFDPLDNDGVSLLPASVRVLSSPAHGSALVNPASGWITYEPAALFNGTDSIAYAACDAAGSCPSATVTIHVALFGPRLIGERLNSGDPVKVTSLDPSGGGERPVTDVAAGSWPVISPDGHFLATVYGPTVFITDLNDPTINYAVGVPDGGVQSPSWAPDSMRLVFHVGGGGGPMYTVRMPPLPILQPEVTPLTYTSPDGSVHQVWGNAPSWRSGDILFDGWFEDGFGTHPGISIMAPGAVPSVLIPEQGAGEAEMGPDGRIVYRTVTNEGCGLGQSRSSITITNGGNPGTTIASTGCGYGFYPDLVEEPTWSPDGSKVAFGSGFATLVANADGSNPTQVDRLLRRASWDPRPSLAPHPPWQTAGQLLVACGSGQAGRDEAGSIVRLNPNGSGRTDFLGSPSAAFLAGSQSSPRWSPDGSMVAFSAVVAPPALPLASIFVMRADGTDLRKLTNVVFIDGDSYTPVWSPDGSRLAFSLGRTFPSAPFGIAIIGADGTGLTRLTTPTPRSDFEPAWSPDGARIAFVRGGPDELWVIPAAGGPAAPILGGIGGRFPAWSPSGDRLAFSANNHVFTATFAASPTPTVSSVLRADFGLPSGVAEDPTWAPGGDTIAYTFHDPSSEYILLANVDGRANTRVTFGAERCFSPHWGPGTALPAPTITSASPSSGPTAGGTALTITGTGFVPGTTVRLDGVLATAVGGSPTTLDVTTPAHAAGPVEVAVANPDGQTAYLASGFTYIAPSAAPTIATVTPDSGPTAGGTAVTVTGTGFGPGSTVTIGGLLATAVGGSATTLDVTTPAHPSGAVGVVVTNPDGQTATLTDGFTYTAPVAGPTITSVSPNTGPSAGGTSVTVTGTGFGPGTTITIDGLTAAAIGGSPTTLDVTTPAHAPGAVDVVVANPDGQTATLTGGFTYADPNPAPTITSVAPASGTTTGGTSVTITGTGFGGPGTTATFDGLGATITGGSSTSLIVTTPAHASGPVDVVVTNSDGQSTTLVAGFLYTTPVVAAPTITSVKPTQGNAKGGTKVTITGTGFVVGLTVSFGDVAGRSIVIKSPTKLVVVTPPHAKGLVTIVVTNPNGQSAVAAVQFKYR